MDDCEYTIVNIYAPNKLKDGNEFFKKIPDFINKYACTKCSILIGGDFNYVLTKSDRVSNLEDSSTSSLKFVLSSLSLYDSSKVKNQHKVQYTYFDPQLRGSNSRIDFWFGSQTIFHKFDTCQIIPSACI